MKIFCLPSAGSSASSYLNFTKSLNQAADFIVIEYPGHGTRLKEELLTNMESFVQYVLFEISNHISESEKFMILGHSMGAMIAYEVAHVLNELEDDRLVRVFVCGCVSPNYIIDAYQKYKHLSDNLFMKEIYELGGVAEEVLKSELFRDIFLKVLRQDFNMINDYVPKMKSLNLPISVFVADRDKITNGRYQFWEFFSNDIDFCTFVGDHFFVINSTKVVEKIYSYC